MALYGHILPQLYMGYNVSEAMRNLPYCDGLYHRFGIFKMVPGVYTQVCTSSAHSMFIQDPSVQCHVMFFSNIKSEFMAIFAPLRCPGEHCTKNMRQDQDSHRRLKIPSFCVGDSMESPKTHNNFWLVVLTCFNPLEKY